MPSLEDCVIHILPFMGKLVPQHSKNKCWNINFTEWLSVLKFDNIHLKFHFHSCLD